VDVGYTLNTLAQIYTAQGQYAEAEQHFLAALKILENSLGQNHPALSRCMRNYAVLLHKTGRKAAAKEAKARADSILFSHRRGPAELIVDLPELEKQNPSKQ
jgi:tetratricopeptide (TPR) repeat protein